MRIVDAHLPMGVKPYLNAQASTKTSKNSISVRQHPGEWTGMCEAVTSKRRGELVRRFETFVEKFREDFNVIGYLTDENGEDLALFMDIR